MDRVLDRAGCVRGGIEPLTSLLAIGYDASVVGSKTDRQLKLFGAQVCRFF